MISKNKRDYREWLPEVLWTYHTTVRGATQFTPFSLVYGCEAVLPFEIQIPSLQIVLASGMDKEENAKLRL